MTTEAPALELLTSTRMRTFRDCARKHKLTFVDGWRPVQTGDALRFGTLVHRALEAYWKCLVRDANQLLTEEYGRDGNIHLAYEAALAAIEGKGFDQFEQVRAEEMLTAYASRWLASDLTDYDVLAVESRFECALLNPETMSPSRTWKLAGKIDVVVRRRSDGRVLVVEHKTTSDNVSADDADYWTKLAMDPQISEYVIGAESLGYPVDEVLYDVLGKPMQRPKLATPVEDRKFTKDGRLYATQREFDETPDEYRVRVRAAIAENPARFIARKSIPRAESQIADFLADAWAQAGQMRDSARLGRAPRNSDACDRFGRCPFWNLCSTGGKPEDYPADYFQPKNRHPELEDSAR